MRWFGLWVLMAGILTGCYAQKIETAFEEEVSPVESNRIINNYCRSCHIHRNFNASGHVEEQVRLYKRKVFRYATECRTCHYLEKKFSLNDFTRKTRRPEEANHGKFRDFEREVLETQKDVQK